MMRKVLFTLLSTLALLAGGMSVTTGAAEANADPCLGTWTIGIGGLGDNTSSVFAPFVNVPVGYNSWDPASGVNEINRLYWDHKNQCPGDWIKLAGHSEGAGLLHSWTTNVGWVDNTSVILLADPKRWAPGFGGPGLANTPGSGIFPGYPLAGVDDWFSIPVLTICNADDVICDSNAGWDGYLFKGAHGRYDFNVNNYGNGWSGIWWP